MQVKQAYFPCHPHTFTPHTRVQMPLRPACAGVGVELLHVAVMKTVLSVTLYLYKDNERPGLGASFPGLVACVFSK